MRVFDEEFSWIELQLDDLVVLLRSLEMLEVAEHIEIGRKKLLERVPGPPRDRRPASDA
jgi:hypothetical protein